MLWVYFLLNLFLR